MVEKPINTDCRTKLNNITGIDFGSNRRQETAEKENSVCKH